MLFHVLFKLTVAFYCLNVLVDRCQIKMENQRKSGWDLISVTIGWLRLWRCYHSNKKKLLEISSALETFSLTAAHVKYI